MIPYGMTFKQALRSGHVTPLRSKNYRDWVKQQTCPCGMPATDPSHVNTYKGMGTKAPDIFVWPSCRPCHELYERDKAEWREMYGSEWEAVALTIAKAVYEGVITL